ncbi:Phytochelatin-domain-containing protein, partial [Gonapodya prolifera JEL478]
MNALPQSASILATSAESGAGVEQNPYTGSNSSNFLSPPSVTTSFNTEQAPPHIPSSQSSTHVHPQPLVFPPSISPQPSPLEPDLLSRTFYRRALPPNLISFTSTHGKRLFREALLDGRGESYFSLVGNFTSQSHPALCGLGSLAMVLNALEVDPKRRWKGVWRWWSDEMLNLCTPLSKIQRRGVTFRDFECIAKRNGLTVIPRRYDNTTYIEFLQDIELTSTSPDVLMVASFSRKAMGCTGDGHFSPVCAYHRGEDRVLVLDVARFKYPSYFASTRELYEAMKPIDKETNLPRGYFLLR